MKTPVSPAARRTIVGAFCLGLLSAFCGCNIKAKVHDFIHYDVQTDTFHTLKMYSGIVAKNGEQARRIGVVDANRQHIITIPQLSTVLGEQAVLRVGNDAFRVFELDAFSTVNGPPKKSPVRLDGIAIKPGRFFMGEGKYLCYYHQVSYPGPTLDALIGEWNKLSALQMSQMALAETKRRSNGGERVTWDTFRFEYAAYAQRGFTSDEKGKPKPAPKSNLEPMRCLDEISLARWLSASAQPPQTLSRKRTVFTVQIPLSEDDARQAAVTINFVKLLLIPHAASKRSSWFQPKIMEAVSFGLQAIVDNRASMIVARPSAKGLQIRTDVAPILAHLKKSKPVAPDVGDEMRLHTTTTLASLMGRGIALEPNQSLEKVVSAFYSGTLPAAPVRKEVTPGTGMFVPPAKPSEKPAAGAQGASRRSPRKVTPVSRRVVSGTAGSKKSAASRPAVIFVVHGTYGATGDWPRQLPGKATFGSELIRGTSAKLIPFLWRSSIHHDRRLQAARDLARELDAQAGKRIVIVGHSHGGNVALAAAGLCKKAKIDTVVCVATPHICLAVKAAKDKSAFLPVYCSPAARQRIGKIYNLASAADSVVTRFAGFRKGIDDQTAIAATRDWQRLLNNPRLARDGGPIREIIAEALKNEQLSSNLEVLSRLAIADHNLAITSQAKFNTHYAMHSRRMGWLIGRLIDNPATGLPQFKDLCLQREADFGEPVDLQKHLAWIAKSTSDFRFSGWMLKSITITSKSRRKPSGRRWDIDGSSPDVAYELRGGGRVISRVSNTLTDKQRVRWTPGLHVRGSNPITLYVWDRDAFGDHDLMGSAEFSPKSGAVSIDKDQFSAEMVWARAHF